MLKLSKEQIVKRLIRGFRGANREFSQELPEILMSMLDLIPEGGNKSIILDFGEWEPDDSFIALSRAINAPSKAEILTAFENDIPIFIKIDLGASGGAIFQRITLTADGCYLYFGLNDGFAVDIDR